MAFRSIFLLRNDEQNHARYITDKNTMQEQNRLNSAAPLRDRCASPKHRQNFFSWLIYGLKFGKDVC